MINTSHVPLAEAASFIANSSVTEATTTELAHVSDRSKF